MSKIVGNTVAITATSAPGDTIFTAQNKAGKGYLVGVYVTGDGGDLTIIHDVGSGHPIQSADQHTIVNSLILSSVGDQQLVALVPIYGHVTDPDKLTAHLDAAGTIELVITAEEIINQS